MLISLPIPSHFSFKECLWFLDRNYDDCMHLAQNGKVTKALFVAGQEVVISISQEGKQLCVELLKGKNNARLQHAIGEYVTEWFDLKRDLRPFYGLLQQHPTLSYLSKVYRGLRLISIPDLFEALCWSVIGQQINLPFAYKLKRRLVELYGKGIVVGERTYYLFPEPAVLARLSVESLKVLQFSMQKAQYLIGIARAFEEGSISKEILQLLPDRTARYHALIALKGVGPWTANYALMKSLREPEGIPHGDAGLLNALLNHKLISTKKDQGAIHQLFQLFPGWENYLVFYLWRSLAA